MLSAVKFNDQFLFCATKVRDVAFDGSLSPQLETRELSITKMPPELFFSRSYLTPEGARAPM